MNKFFTKEIKDKKVWEHFLLKKNVKSFLQSWNWGETNRLAGFKIIRLGFWQNNELIGVCLLVKEIAKRGTYFYVSGGPVLDWEKKLVVKYVVETLTRIAKKEGAWFIRIRPEILDNQDNRRMFRKLKFVSSPMHLHAENTWLVDLRGNEEDVLLRMRKTTRYLVRKGLREGYEFATMNNKNGIDALYKLQMETAKRHGFVPFSKKYFLSELNSFSKDKQIELFVVKKSKKILVAALIIFYKDTAYYHFSGSSQDSTKTNASYFMQWNVILEAKKRGCSFYNMWGISPEGSKKHRFLGVTLFKTGFGGERIDWLHAQDLPVSNRYWLTFGFETLRRKLRGL